MKTQKHSAPLESSITGAKSELVVRFNGTDAAFPAVGLAADGHPHVCTSVSFYVFHEGQRRFHALLDCGPGVPQSLMATRWPQPWAPDILVLSHAHGDHTKGIDTLINHWRRQLTLRGESAPPPLPIYCLPETFIDAIPEFLRSHFELILAQPLESRVLWKSTDGSARLEILTIEVVHFKRSAVHVVTLHHADEGEEQTTRVVALFDIGSFYPQGTSQYSAGNCAEHPALYNPDLLIAEANTWSPRERTGHVAFETLAEWIVNWNPAATRILHYSGGEDPLSPNSPGKYWALADAGDTLVHPRLGPVPLGVLTGAMQQHLKLRGFPHPESVSAANGGELHLVNPALRTDELIVEVAEPGPLLEVKGPIPRKFAHTRGIRHTTSLILPARGGLLVLHERINSKGKKTLNVFGGHVAWHPDLLSGGLVFLKEHVLRSACREANEEICCHPKQCFFNDANLRLIGEIGEFTWGVLGTGNVEASSLFVLPLPADVQSITASDPGEGKTVPPETLEFSLDELIEEHQRDAGRFSDGLARILERLRGNDERARQLDHQLRGQLCGGHFPPTG